MATKKKRRVLSGYDNEMAGVGRRKRRKKAKRKGSRKALKRVFRVVSKAKGLRSKGRLKKGCKWGRGRYKGKVLCAAPKRKAG